MPTTHATNREQLQKRLRRFLEAPALRERRNLREDILPFFAGLGPTVIIGGLPRDIARKGWQGFSSDIDLVVQPTDYGRYKSAMEEMGAVRNRFGGYGMAMGGWRVDAWALSDTWAREAGHRRVNEFSDLLDCTFFDSDAVLYNVTTRRVIARGDYFERLSNRILDINLAENPNVLGSALRTLRRALAWDVRLSARLADYVLGAVAAHGWHALVELERTAFHHSIVRHEDADRIIQQLQERERAFDQWATGRLAERPYQLQFPERALAVG
jgi:hypothetical protein